MMKNNASDLEIIDKVISGDTQSFEKMIKRYEGKLLRLCHSMVGESQAEDAAQEIFLKAYESLGQFKGDSSFSTWLYRIASHHCLNIISKRKREKTESLDALIEKLGDHIPMLTENHLVSNAFENQQMVQLVLDQLSSEERIILALREMEGLSYKELSETFEISQDLVKVRLFRARKNFLEIAKKIL